MMDLKDVITATWRKWEIKLPFQTEMLEHQAGCPRHPASSVENQLCFTVSDKKKQKKKRAIV